MQVGFGFKKKQYREKDEEATSFELQATSFTRFKNVTVLCISPYNKQLPSILLKLARSLKLIASNYK
jgi:hypothetical protein